ncbi:MAG TPA: efflux RND transporter permease subunit [Terriglobia bacterium]|nr:efflux RND transporter permease subunit [Terriglobia bacterium]
MIGLAKKLDSVKTPEGTTMERDLTGQPFLTNQISMEWDGEWQITYEVFSDLGLAFGVALVLIYVIVVAWFESFRVPLVIMAPIPLTLVGILPAHALMGAFFTATSIIGVIALAGIIVRNSILVVDFADLRRRQGMPLDDPDRLLPSLLADRGCCPPGEAHARPLGLYYRVRSSNEINWVVQRNLQFLEDYLCTDFNRADRNGRQWGRAMVSAEPGISLSELFHRTAEGINWKG